MGDLARQLQAINFAHGLVVEPEAGHVRRSERCIACLTSCQLFRRAGSTDQVGSKLLFASSHVDNSSLVLNIASPRLFINMVLQLCIAALVIVQCFFNTHLCHPTLGGGVDQLGTSGSNATSMSLLQPEIPWAFQRPSGASPDTWMRTASSWGCSRNESHSLGCNQLQMGTAQTTAIFLELAGSLEFAALRQKPSMASAAHKHTKSACHMLHLAHNCSSAPLLPLLFTSTSEPASSGGVSLVWIACVAPVLLFLANSAGRGIAISSQLCQLQVQTEAPAQGSRVLSSSYRSLVSNRRFPIAWKMDSWIGACCSGLCFGRPVCPWGLCGVSHQDFAASARVLLSVPRIVNDRRWYCCGQQGRCRFKVQHMKVDTVWETYQVRGSARPRGGGMQVEALRREYEARRDGVSVRSPIANGGQPQLQQTDFDLCLHGPALRQLREELSKQTHDTIWWGMLPSIVSFSLSLIGFMQKDCGLMHLIAVYSSLLFNIVAVLRVLGFCRTDCHRQADFL